MSQSFILLFISEIEIKNQHQELFRMLNSWFWLVCVYIKSQALYSAFKFVFKYCALMFTEHFQICTYLYMKNFIYLFLSGSGFYLFLIHCNKNNSLLEFKIFKDHSKIEEYYSENILSILCLKNASLHNIIHFHKIYYYKQSKQNCIM